MKVHVWSFVRSDQLWMYISLQMKPNFMADTAIAKGTVSQTLCYVLLLYNKSRLITNENKLWSTATD